MVDEDAELLVVANDRWPRLGLLGRQLPVIDHDLAGLHVIVSHKITWPGEGAHVQVIVAPEHGALFGIVVERGAAKALLKVGEGGQRVLALVDHLDELPLPWRHDEIEGDLATAGRLEELLLASGFQRSHEGKPRLSIALVERLFEQVHVERCAIDHGE